MLRLMELAAEQTTCILLCAFCGVAGSALLVRGVQQLRGSVLAWARFEGTPTITLAPRGLSAYVTVPISFALPDGTRQQAVHSFSTGVWLGAVLLPPGEFLVRYSRTAPAVVYQRWDWAGLAGAGVFFLAAIPLVCRTLLS
jgi:hypothetical protein